MKIISICILFSFLAVSEEVSGRPVAPAPLFQDPVYQGSCDPEIIWNHNTREWWIFYTGRRSTLEGGQTWYACAIGVVASMDGREWRHLGYCKFDGKGGVPEMEDTYWAPGIIRDGETYHMFVTLLPGHPEPFTGKANIMHYTAQGDLLNNWTRVSPIPIDGRVIDAGLHKVGDEWRLWHKQEGTNGSRIGLLTSPDLMRWTRIGPVQGKVNAEGGDISMEGGHEGPYIFHWKGWYWMITDPHQGIFVYRSKDADVWERAGTILLEPGTRPFDNSRGRHASVVVAGERAFIVYHVEPGRDYVNRKSPQEKTVPEKVSFLQAAELEYRDGRIYCDRDKPFDFFLPPGP